MMARKEEILQYLNIEIFNMFPCYKQMVTFSKLLVKTILKDLLCNSLYRTEKNIITLS